jgi:hypothetical protein
LQVHVNDSRVSRGVRPLEEEAPNGRIRVLSESGRASQEPGVLAGRRDHHPTNLRVALTAANAGVEHIVKWTVYVVQGQPLGPALGAFQQVLGKLPNPPTISVLFVAGLANPDFLLEVDAIAVVP